MAGKKIGVIIACDGEKEFSQQIRNANKEASLFKSEMKQLAQQFDGNANSMEFLRRKQEILTKEQEAYNKKLEAAKKGLEKANDNYNNQIKRLDELKQSLSEAEKELEKMKAAGQEGTSSYKKQEKAVQDLTSAVSKQELAKQREIGSISDWNKKVIDAEIELRKINKTIDKNAKYLNEAENSADKCAKSIDEFGEAVEKAQKTESTWIGAAKEGLMEALASKGLDVATNAVEASVEAVKDSMYDLSGASAKLAASTGLSESAMVKYRKVMNEIKGDNFGEDYSDISSVMTEIVQIMGELNDADMTSVTESAITLRDTFGMDVNESIRAADVMMKTMGVDATTAFDLITAGAQNGLNRSGELVDNITEYASLWGQAGFSAEEMFAILENGLDSGAYNLDKVNDYVKEFGNSLADGRIEENLSSFSTETQGLFQKWKDGEASTSDVFYSVINDLSEMTNQQEALTLASEVWSALGEDNAMQVLTALDNVNDKYKDVKGSMDSLKEVRYSDLESAVSGLGAAVQENLIAPITDAALPAVTGAFETATKVIEGIGEAITPQKTAVDEFVESIQTANDDLQTTLQNADTTIQNAELEAGKIETLGTQLISLNGVEEKSLAQKFQMKEIVSKLGEAIPEIAAAYDEEAGSVDLTDAAIRRLIGSTKELVIAQAAQNAMQEVATELIEAQIALKNAETAQSVAADKKAMYEEEKQLLMDLQDEYAQYEQALASAADGDAVAEIEANYTNAAEVERRYLEFWDEQLASGRATIEEYNAALENVGIGQLSNRMVKNENDCAQWSDTYREASGSVEELAGGVEEANAKVEEYSETVKEAETALTAEEQALTANADSSAYAAAEKDRLASGNRDAADAAKDSAEATDTDTDALKANEEAAEAAAEAMQGIRDAYESTRSEIESSLQNKISLTDMFDGGEDITTEQMNENLQSYLDGIANYRENLAKVRAMTDENGKALFSPEVMAEIEKGGTEYANMLSHMVYTWEEQGEYGYEQIKGIAGKWTDALDTTEGMAEVQAANRVAMEQLTGDLGSTDVEFQDLRDSVNAAVASAAEGWAGLPEATEKAIEDTITAAQQCGIKIPEGLAEGIASGEISPEAALEQLNGTMQGTFNGLAEMAKDLGIGDDIISGLTESIEAGGPEAADAITQLAGMITGASPELQKAVEDIVKADGVKSAVQESVEPGADAIGEAAPEYQNRAEELGDAVAEGIRKGKEEVTAAVREITAAGAEEAGRHTEEYTRAGTDLGAAVSEGLQQALSEDGGAVILNPDGITENANEYEAAGEALGDAVAKGLGNKQTEINEALSPDAGGLMAGSGEYESAGQSLGEAFARGISSAAEAADSAGMSLSEEAIAAIRSQIQQMQEAAQAQAKTYTDALNAARSQAGQAGGNLGSSARSGAAAWQNSFYSIGTNMAAGLASGIRSGQSGAISAAANMAAQALSAAKRELDIHSPSKKFRDDVGRQVGKGFAFGIKDTESLAGSAAANMSNTVYTKAVSWLSKYKKTHKVSLEEEKYYWEQVAKHTKQGTDAYSEAIAKMLKAGVSKTTGSGKKKKSKDAETYYSEIYSAASKYLSNQQVLNDWSLQQELSYWTAVQKQLKSGTQAWYDATKEIKSLQAEIMESEADAAKERIQTQANVQKDLLSKYKVYHNMSAKAEMEYWDIARKQFVSGTDERIEADENYLNAKEEYYEKLGELDEDYAENKKKLDDELAESIADLQKAYDDAVAKREQEIKSSMSLFESWDAEGYKKDILTENLKTQVEGLRFWEEQLEELSKKKITADLLEELKEMGPEAAANIWSLNQMTAEELEEYNSLWSEKNELAHKQAVEENADLLRETNDAITEARKTAQDEMAALQKDYRSAISELNTGLSDGLKGLVDQAGKIGEEIVSKLVDAIKNANTAEETKKALASASGIINGNVGVQNALAPEASPARAAAAVKSEPEKSTKSTEKETVLAIINSGKAHKKSLSKTEEKEHHDLWKYIVKKYGHEPTFKIYKSLADVIGVKADDKATDSQKNKILAALKKKGYASGVSRLKKPEWNWTQEEGLELIGTPGRGVWTPLPEGSTVYTAAMSQNLLDWGEQSPSEYLEVIQRGMKQQQAKMREQIAGMNFSGLTKLNQLMEDYQSRQVVVNVDNSEMIQMAQQILFGIQNAVDAISNMQMVTDTGVLAGEMQPIISKESAAITVRRNRGRLK